MLARHNERASSALERFAFYERATSAFAIVATGGLGRGELLPYSDLDLVLMGATPLPMTTLGLLNEAFAESDLPWRVDVVDWASTAPEFQRHIADHSVPLPL